jgi:hypothetical protein
MTKPAFVGLTSFNDITVKLNSVGSFAVPAFSDDDGDATTISLSSSALPGWVQLTNSDTKLEAAPTQFAEVGTHPV